MEISVEQQDIATIINQELRKSEFYIHSDEIQPSDVNFANRYDIQNILVFEHDKNPISKILDRLSRNRYKDFGQFHHFKSAAIALNIIQNQEIQVSSLFSNDANDFAEYTEFYKRIGLFHPLIPENYQQKAFNNKINPKDENPSDPERQHIFVLCFTQDNHNEKFWRQYANEDHGVAIGFRFSDFEDEGKHLYDLRDVFYDNGYSIDFYNAINYQLRKYNKMLFTNGVDKFAKFYKRSKYAWENETRLCFHYDVPGTLGVNGYLTKAFPIETNESTGRRYITLPLQANASKNPFFNLTVTELVCGKYVNEGIANELKKALANSFPLAKFWQRI